MHPIFEAVYVPAFIKAANAEGRVFADLEDLGAAMLRAKEAAESGDAPVEKTALLGAVGRVGRAVWQGRGAAKGLAQEANAGLRSDMSRQASRLRGVPKMNQLATQSAGLSAAVPNAQKGLTQAQQQLTTARQALLSSLKGQKVLRDSPAHQRLMQLSKQMEQAGMSALKFRQGANVPRGTAGVVSKLDPRMRAYAQTANNRLSGFTSQQAALADLMRQQGTVQGGIAARQGYSQTARTYGNKLKGSEKVYDNLGNRGYQAVAGTALAGGGVGAAITPSPGAAQAAPAVADKTGAVLEKFARLKVAARIINADIGLDQLINHMKKARAKKVAQA